VRLRLLTVAALVALAVGCADQLPDQDLRILSATPSAKLSTDDIWKDFQADPAAARSRYFGKAVDISGRIVSIEADPSKQPHVFFGRAGEPGVRARLLDDQAAETAKAAVVGSRITLRCFCEGLDDQHDVLLKSCIRPQ
jgi:hypothetical protein